MRTSETVSIIILLLILYQSSDALVSTLGADVKVLPSKIDGFKMDLHRILEGSRVRKKRELPNSPSEHQMRVGSAASIEIPYLSDYKLTFWTPVEHPSGRQVLIGTEDGHLILFAISPDEDTLGHIVAHSYEKEVAKKAKAFTYLDEQWFVVLQSARNQTWIRLYLKEGRILEQRQSIILDGEADIDLITMKGVTYLVVTTYQKSRNQGSLAVYEWYQTQFDLKAYRTVYGPRSVSCWVLYGTLYIAAAQNVYGEESVYGSPIYIYNARDERGLVLHQMLSIYGPIKVLHFYVNSNHYVIFIGKQEAAIYWWSNNQFLLWQVIQNTANAIDASILSLENGEVLIVIALKEEILYATLDSSGHYVVSFTMSFSGYSLSSVQFMFSGQAYYALTLFATAYAQKAQGTYKLTLDPYFNPGESGLDTLRSCLKDVSDFLDERQNEMNNIHVDLNRVWLRNADQKIKPEVYITGIAHSNRGSILHEVVVILDRKVLPTASLPEIDSTVSRYNAIAINVQNKMGDSVRMSIQQNISGELNFDYPVYIPSLNLKSTDLNLPINGIPVSNINEKSLRITGDQTFTEPIQTINMYGSNINTEYVNGITTDDFLRLSGNQQVNGNLEFFNVQADEIRVNTVNSISTSNFVTKHSDQILNDLKSISWVNADVINVEGQTNGEILKDLLGKTILKYTDDEIKGSISLVSPTYIVGDIFLSGMINGLVDLAYLIENSVTKYDVQTIKGINTFESPIIVQDMTVLGKVNNINLDQLLTLSTDQIVNSQLFFDNYLFVYNNLFTRTVNDINLSELAVLKKSEHQFIMGMDIFLQDVTADFIDMTDYVTLDGVDPSSLVQDIVNHNEGKVRQDHTYFHKVVVLGNLTAVNGINGYGVFDLPTTVWLKNTPQVIDVPISVTQVSMNNDVFVQYINALHLDSDVVRSYGDDIITSVKYFYDVVGVSESVDAEGTAMLNGMNVVTFKTEFDNYVEEGTVQGQKILGYLEIYGDINANMLNTFEVFNNIMHPRNYQIISVPVRFVSELSVMGGSLLSTDIKFDRFNSMDFKSYLDHAVTKDPTKAMKNKRFPLIQGAHLAVPESSRINDIPFTWLLANAVTLDGPQQILSHKLFANDLQANTLTSLLLNGRNVSTLVEVVVLTDNSITISSKRFLGFLQAFNIYTDQPVNGVFIDQMIKNAVLKTEDTTFKQPVTFLNGIHIRNLITSSSLDGVYWNDLIYIKNDEILDAFWLMSDTNSLANIFVQGNINNCNLTQLEQNALYYNKPRQHIKESMTIESIEVIGNIHIADVVNELPVNNLLKKLVLLTGDQVVTSDVVLENGTKALNINVAQLADFNLPLILSDAVRHSVPQDILGYKKFSHLKVNVLEADNLFVSRTLNTIYIDHLYNSIVWKEGHQIINGEKIFGPINTQVATIEGYLNGLKIPNDLVKVDADEVIASPIVFLSDVILPNNLEIHGMVDGTNLAKLIQDRITLGANEDLNSQIYFHSEVIIGELKIDGAINDVILEMVARTSQNTLLDGYKVFIQDLHLLESLNVSYVNGYTVKTLDENILKRNEEDFIKDLQVFEKPLKAGSHLFTDLINSISLTDITSSFFSMVGNFNRTLSYLEDLSYGFLKLLTRQVDSLKRGISKFAYFLLLQEIDLGPTVRILNGYRFEHSDSDYSHSMIIWTSRKHCMYTEKCCHEEFSHWMRVRRTGHMAVDSNPEPGRLYPVHNPAPVTTNKDFFIWTNATGYEPKWCRNNQDEKMLLASLTDLKYMEVFMDIRNSPSLSDVKSFRKGNLYAVAGFYYDRKEAVYSSATVYKFNEIQREWTEHQLLPSYGVLSLDIVADEMTNELLLAVGTAVGGHSTVYKWDDLEHKFIVLQNIPTQFVTSTKWLKQESIQLLAMANVEQWPRKEAFCSDLVSGGGINIYIYNKNIRFSQNIPLSGVVSLVSFNLDGDTYLVAASIKLQTVFVYEWKGYSGFSLIQTMYVGEVTHLNSYQINDDFYMTVATLTGPAKVLKIVVQGKSLVQTLTPTSVSQNPYAHKIDAQKDEARKEEKIGC